jgi:hypothetical protein
MCECVVLSESTSMGTPVFFFVCVCIHESPLAEQTAPLHTAEEHLHSPPRQPSAKRACIVPVKQQQC